MRKSLIIISTFCLGLTAVKSQDIHFSQFNASPMNINPALTGLFSGDWRFVGNHRNQWSSVTVPYVTSSASLDMNFKASKQSQDLMGAGILVNRDKAGDSEFGGTHIMGALSYTKMLQESPNMFLTYGMMAGVFQRSLNYQDLKFGNQWNGDRYDANIPPEVDMSQTNSTYFDAAAGFNFFTNLSENSNGNAGISFYHVNKPTQSLVGDGEIRLQPRMTFHSNFSLYLNERFDILPGILLMHQNNNNQITLGTYGKYKIRTERNGGTAVYAGAFGRLKDRDAVILIARLEHNRLNIGLSYDINLSKLNVASNNRGGFELSLMLILPRSKPPIRVKNVPCPIFM